MSDFLQQDWSSYMIIAMGLILLAVTWFSSSKVEELSAKGEKVEGVIFETDNVAGFHVSWFGNSQADMESQRATVRFVTKKMEWITAEIENTFLVRSPYRQGDKVTVYYNPENPRDFIVTQGGNFNLKKWLLIIAAVLLIFGGLLGVLLDL